jgi:hypothetical protein
MVNSVRNESTVVLLLMYVDEVSGKLNERPQIEVKDRLKYLHHV